MITLNLSYLLFLSSFLLPLSPSADHISHSPWMYVGSCAVSEGQTPFIWQSFWMPRTYWNLLTMCKCYKITLKEKLWKLLYSCKIYTLKYFIKHWLEELIAISSYWQWIFLFYLPNGIFGTSLKPLRESLPNFSEWDVNQFYSLQKVVQ